MLYNVSVWVSSYFFRIFVFMLIDEMSLEISIPLLT